MKKSTKIAFIVLLSLTVVMAAAAISMLAAISGDNLMYMNSVAGSIIVSCYRWVCLAALILVIFWIVVLLINSKKIIAKIKLASSDRAAKKAAQPIAAETPAAVAAPSYAQAVQNTSAVETSAPVAAAVSDRTAPDQICPKCLTPLPATAKFCGKCGTFIKPLETAPTPHYCSNCGAELETNAMFCSVCGKKQ